MHDSASTVYSLVLTPQCSASNASTWCSAPPQASAVSVGFGSDTLPTTADDKQLPCSQALVAATEAWTRSALLFVIVTYVRCPACESVCAAVFAFVCCCHSPNLYAWWCVLCAQLVCLLMAGRAMGRLAANRELWTSSKSTYMLSGRRGVHVSTRC